MSVAEAALPSRASHLDGLSSDVEAAVDTSDAVETMSCVACTCLSHWRCARRSARRSLLFFQGFMLEKDESVADPHEETAEATELVVETAHINSSP